MTKNNPKDGRFRFRGFALVATLSMMILLTIIAVGLLSLSSISLRASSQGDAMATAKSNARMALMLAIGELQRELGPDSRISAPHDAGSAASGGDPHWIAVYDAWKRPVANTPESPGSRSPVFRGWLASGANQALGGPPGTPDRVLLVGPGSLGSTSSPDDEVRVPMHEVVVGSIPGRYAWWVSDEGIKAKINAGPDSVAASSFGASDPLFHSQSPPKVEHRAFPSLATLTWEDGKRSKTISTGQVTLSAGIGRDGLGNSIHDLTVHSAGVLADVREGRLRRDLGNLLSRPQQEVIDKPLYLADGRMNRFTIAEDGVVTNDYIVKPWEQSYNTADHWGINLEELHLFQNLHRELDWSGGEPGLLMKYTREKVVNDAFFMYRRPVLNAQQYLFSLKAVPSGADYKMQLYLDGLIALQNPNDVKLISPPGLMTPFQLFAIPYNLKWNITKKAGGSITTTPKIDTQEFFLGYIEGGAAGVPAKGYVLEPGEAAAFGSSTSDDYNMNLSRGFVPKGGVKLDSINLNASGLKPDDTVDYEFNRSTSLLWNGSFSYTNAWLGRRRINPAPQIGWQMDGCVLWGRPPTAPGPEKDAWDAMLPPTIRPTQPNRTVQQFIDDKIPVLAINWIQNIEQESGGSTAPTAFASRPYQIYEPALNQRHMNTSRRATDIHATQMLVTAEPLDSFVTLAAGPGGRNVYIGGSRGPSSGGSFQMISRRIPIVPPQSLGAFENAIASGFCDHFSDSSKRGTIGASGMQVGNDPNPLPTQFADARGLTGHVHALPLVSKAIGNSHIVPNLPLDKVFMGSNGITTAVQNQVGKVATDHSWMVNTALWDSWFLSSIVDGTGAGASPWQTDNRSQRYQFRDLAEGRKTLRNKRYLFHSHKAPADALTELFDGENLKPSAINTISKYLLIDGAFNVNSTSIPAWTAFLSSVRDQALMTGSGSTKAFNHPFGTLGYAASTATSGTEGDWSGLRDLSVTDMEKLASAIVTEVKERGPFLSLADFVNRRPNSSEPVQQSLGALQAAINLAGINDKYSNGGRAASSADFAGLKGSSGIDKEPKPARAVGSPGHLSQGSLLTAIGAQITVRSDTFTIRAYGDTRDASDRIIAKAWCEAVIQRVPEYVDPTNPPEAQNAWPDSSDTLTPANARFGRRMEIRSFRWLGSNEI